MVNTSQHTSKQRKKPLLTKKSTGAKFKEKSPMNGEVTKKTFQKGLTKTPL